MTTEAHSHRCELDRQPLPCDCTLPAWKIVGEIGYQTTIHAATGAEALAHYHDGGRSEVVATGSVLLRTWNPKHGDHTLKVAGSRVRTYDGKLRTFAAVPATY